jgi:UDP-N-acetylglucosamine 2-epimerase (non-hydrolysing)
MEAGNRCFDPRVPEELNRRLIDHAVDINLPYSQRARDYLIREGIPAQRIVVTGSPMREVLNYYRPNIEASKVLDHLNLSRREFYVVSLHREENVDNLDTLRRFFETFDTLAREHNMPVVVSTHPRTRKRLGEINLQLHENVRLLSPMSFSDYVNLQIHSRAVLSDSGTISEEAAILKLRALNLRESHERPEAMDEAAAVMVGCDRERIFQALQMVTDAEMSEHVPEIPLDYQSLNVSQKVCRIICSYINRASDRSISWF